MTSNGEILTNNHVVNGATSVSVTDIGNGKTYKATVVGYDESHDVAVLQLSGASGLTTATTGNSSTVKRRRQRGRRSATQAAPAAPPSVAPGTVTALNQSITASDEGSGSSEQLSGLIETNANIQPGDSGGPLVNSYGQIIGMDTAASTQLPVRRVRRVSGGFGGFGGFGGSAGSAGPAPARRVHRVEHGSSSSGQDSSTQGYAIPIDTALSIASQIEAGQASSTVHIGATAFLGLEIASSDQQDSSGRGARGRRSQAPRRPPPGSARAT